MLCGRGHEKYGMKMFLIDHVNTDSLSHALIHIYNAHQLVHTCRFRTSPHLVNNHHCMPLPVQSKLESKLNKLAKGLNGNGYMASWRFVYRKMPKPNCRLVNSGELMQLLLLGALREGDVLLSKNKRMEIVCQGNKTVRRRRSSDSELDLYNRPILIKKFLIHVQIFFFTTQLIKLSATNERLSRYYVFSATIN